ncbi:hypothetical protein NKH18_45085 [Streptomyces sp. M10(2022)]
MFLRELTDRGSMPTDGLDDMDRTVLARLDAALKSSSSTHTGRWPDRCAGPIAAELWRTNEP